MPALAEDWKASSPDGLEIGGSAASICRSAGAIHSNVTRMWLFNCQDRTVVFVLFAFFFLRMAGFKGKVPRELPAADFFYPEAEVVRGAFY